jgi:glycosyltransferase involved in cell wall biosynthesis
MRIALVPSLVSPLRRAEANGPHAVIVDLARGLAARGHGITLYGAAGSDVEGFEVREIPVEPAAHGAQVGATPSRGATQALNRAFARLFDDLRCDPPDAISQHAFDAAAIELAEGLPVLHTLHLPPLVPEVVIAARATRSSLATVSHAARASWRAAGVNDVAVLRNGVPDSEPLGGAIVPVALIAGRISPEKGTAGAIRVARRAGLAVLVVGDIYDAEYFASDVEPLLRPGEWIGPVPRRELSELMARCAVLLMPVRWEEPFGLVAAEAQMAGCPVVAYRRGALPEVVPDRIGGWLVEPDDEEGLVTAVHRARGLDRAAIRSRAVRDLGVRHMVDAYERVLVKTAAHEPRVARAS